MSELSLQVRQGLKSYSNWPTYPQLYLEGLQRNYLFVVFHNFLQTLHTVVTALSPIPISPRWVDWRSRHHQRDGGVWWAADHASQEGTSCTLKFNALLISLHPTEKLFTSAKVSLESRLKSLTHQAPVMVFMKVSGMIILQDIWWYSYWTYFSGRPISAKMWLFKAAYADSSGNQGFTDS